VVTVQPVMRARTFLHTARRRGRHGRTYELLLGRNTCYSACPVPEDGTEQLPRPVDKAAALTMLLFAQHPLCVACISGKVGLAVGDIEPTVTRIEQAIAIEREVSHCKVCERWTLVYSLRATP